MTVEELFDILRECASRGESPYLNHQQDEVDVPPRPFDEITIDGTFDTERLLAALNRLKGDKK